MKIEHMITALFAATLLINACKESGDDLDPWVSGPLTEYEVTPIAGGAIISYTIPEDPNILYIMAEYERSGSMYTEKASVHNNELRIEGFNTISPVNVTLYKVNYHEQRSDPLLLTFTPLESLVSQVYSSLSMQPTFGGLVASWVNIAGTELGIHLYKKEKDEMVSQEVYYTTQKEESHSFRGFESEDLVFGIVIEDKWGNSSEMKTATIHPYFETLIEKPYADYRTYIPFDNISNYNANNYPFTRLWDNIYGTTTSITNGWLSRSGNSGCSITIDLKQVAKLSRLVHHFYRGAPYGQANMNGLEIWGIDEIDPETLSNRDYWLDEWSVRGGHILTIPTDYTLPERTFKDDWHYLGSFDVPVYESSTDIANLSTNGAEYTLKDAPPVRYVRLFVKKVQGRETPTTNYFSCSELTFYGDNTVSKN